jgi:hypothetical protein
VQQKLAQLHTALERSGTRARCWTVGEPSESMVVQLPSAGSLAGETNRPW